MSLAFAPTCARWCAGETAGGGFRLSPHPATDAHNLKALPTPTLRRSKLHLFTLRRALPTLCEGPYRDYVQGTYLHSAKGPCLHYVQGTSEQCLNSPAQWSSMTKPEATDLEQEGTQG